MSYLTEFPEFATDVACAEMAKRSEAWEDTSWHNDVAPSFTCDVFVLWIHHENIMEREYTGGPRYAMHCEDECMLETDTWADVLAFMDEGKRDFPAYEWRAEA